MNLNQLKQWARQLKVELLAIHLACRDSRVPWHIKILAIIVVGYAFSPIDLIPDFIPVLGYLDDLILVPLGIFIVLKLLPTSIMAECRLKVQSDPTIRKPKNWIAAGLFVVIWLSVAFLFMHWVTHFFTQ